MFFNYKPNEVKKPPTVYIVQFRYFFSLSKEKQGRESMGRHFELTSPTRNIWELQ